jgi:hypothetical protein
MTNKQHKDNEAQPSHLLVDIFQLLHGHQVCEDPAVTKIHNWEI